MTADSAQSASPIRRALPGIILAALLVAASIPVARWLGSLVLLLEGADPSAAASPISSISVAILLGMLLRNLFPMPKMFLDGLRFCARNVLRLGIVLVGIKLSLLDVFRLGAAGIPVVVVVITSGIVILGWLSRKLNLPVRLGILIAAGTSICGITAIASTAPTIEAEEQEVACSVAIVTLFGLLGMLFYPYLAHAILPSSEQIGLFLGTAIHDTSQVVGAALAYREVFHDDAAFQAATATKLTRNLFLAVVVPLLAYRYSRSQAQHHARKQHAATHSAPRPKPKFLDLFPLFILGFVAMALLRTIGEVTLANGSAFGLWDADSWHSLTVEIGDVWGSRCLALAMASIGLLTRFSDFHTLGWKPFAVGLAGAFLVAASGLAVIFLLNPSFRL